MDYHDAVMALVQLLADAAYGEVRDEDVNEVVNHISPYERDKAFAEAQRILEERNGPRQH